MLPCGVVNYLLWYLFSSFFIYSFFFKYYIRNTNPESTTYESQWQGNSRPHQIVFYKYNYCLAKLNRNPFAPSYKSTRFNHTYLPISLTSYTNLTTSSACKSPKHHHYHLLQPIHYIPIQLSLYHYYYKPPLILSPRRFHFIPYIYISFPSIIEVKQ